MAVATGTNIDEIEWSWFATHISGFTTNTPIEDLKRAYFVSIVGEQAKDEDVHSLEKRWLHSLTGVGASTSNYGDLWREAVVGAGQTPDNDITQNKIIYFKTVA